MDISLCLARPWVLMRRGQSFFLNFFDVLMIILPLPPYDTTHCLFHDREVNIATTALSQTVITCSSLYIYHDYSIVPLIGFFFT